MCIPALICSREFSSSVNSEVLATDRFRLCRVLRAFFLGPRLEMNCVCFGDRQ